MNMRNKQLLTRDKMGQHTWESPLTFGGKYREKPGRQVNVTAAGAGWTFVRNNTSRGGARLRVCDRDRLSAVCAIGVR